MTMLDVKYSAETAHNLYEKESDRMCRAICKFLLGVDPCAEKLSMNKGKEQMAVSTEGKRILERK